MTRFSMDWAVKNPRPKLAISPCWVVLPEPVPIRTCASSPMAVVLSSSLNLTTETLSW